MPNEKVVVVGAGLAGLSTAILLAQRNIESLVVEWASPHAGKLRF